MKNELKLIGLFLLFLGKWVLRILLIIPVAILHIHTYWLTASLLNGYIAWRNHHLQAFAEASGIEIKKLRPPDFFGFEPVVVFLSLFTNVITFSSYMKYLHS